jgi:ABC-type multidrug transport system fused ATPase/permease subunit
MTRNQCRYGLEGTPEEPSQEEIEAAARLANADKFIESMPQKYDRPFVAGFAIDVILTFDCALGSRYDTEVGERGVQLRYERSCEKVFAACRYCNW